MTGIKNLTVNPWLKQGDSADRLPTDARFVCAYDLVRRLDELSAAGPGGQPSRPSTKPGSEIEETSPLEELLRNNHPDLTDEEVRALADIS